MSSISIETSYARVTGTEAKAHGDVICPTNLRYDIFSVADEIIIRRAVHICHTCRSKSNHQTNYNTTTLTYCVRKLEMNHFCQLCGHHIGLLGLMSLDSVNKSMEALLRLFYEKVATPDMIRPDLQLVRKTTECLNLQKIPLLVVDQTLCNITISETLGKDTSVSILGILHIEMA